MLGYDAQKVRQTVMSCDQFHFVSSKQKPTSKISTSCKTPTETHPENKKTNTSKHTQCVMYMSMKRRQRVWTKNNRQGPPDALAEMRRRTSAARKEPCLANADMNREQVLTLFTYEPCFSKLTMTKPGPQCKPKNMPKNQN